MAISDSVIHEHGGPKNQPGLAGTTPVMDSLGDFYWLSVDIINQHVARVWSEPELRELIRKEMYSLWLELKQPPHRLLNLGG